MEQDTGADLAKLAARGVAVGRILIGVGATLAPGLISRAQFGTDTPSQRVLVRLLGGRDLALGVGALLAERHDSAGLRGWVEAGGLADAVDAAALVAGGPAGSRHRALTILAAGGAAVVSGWAARNLSD